MAGTSLSNQRRLRRNGRGGLRVVGCLLLAVALLGRPGDGARAANPGPPTGARKSSGVDQVVLVEYVGRVEVLAAPATEWRRLAPGERAVLRPGDQLRTGARSRATLQFTDHSVFRLNQESRIEVRPSESESSTKSLLLRLGELFFLDREQPSRIRVETPTTTSAIRGTEFLLAVAADEASTELSLLDGEVEFAAGGESARLVSRQRAGWRPGAALEVHPLTLAPNRIQWALYYPTFLEVAELTLKAEESAALGPALERYRAGDVRGALEAWPGPGGGSPDAASPSAQAFEAALLLAVGRTEAAERLVADPVAGDAWAQPFRELLAATRFEALPTLPEPTTVGGWLARSFYEQSRSHLELARSAARAAVNRSPASGSAWVRLAEMEWSFGRRQAALEALAEGRRRSPRDPRAAMLEGYIHLADTRTTKARSAFESARELDASLGDIWIGLGLAAMSDGDSVEARRLLEIAAVLEPQRAVARSYLAKALGAEGRSELAERDFGLALGLDANDPTAWLYRGLLRQSTHRLNDAVRDLEAAVARNDERSVFRSSLRLDQDRAVRQADLALSYAEVGLNEVAERTASRAIEDSYADFAGHLYRARTLQHREDPSRFELSWEAARQNQLLVANLLAPAHGANLSQQFSQQDFYRGFEARTFGGSTLTTYRSGGDWEAAGALYGTEGRLGYAIDGQYLSVSGDQRPDGWELQSFSIQAKQELSPEDGLYVQGGYLHRAGGDLSRLFDSGTAIRGYHFEESEAPSASLGYHRAWTPEQHTLVLVSRIQDRVTVDNPAPEILFLEARGGVPASLEFDPYFASRIETEFPLTSFEVQHLIETEHHTLLVGGRYQGGEVRTDETLVRLAARPLATEAGRPDYAEAAGYSYYTWCGWEPLRLTAGVAFEELRNPANIAWPPLSGGEAHHSQVSPKAGLTYTPWKGGHLRAMYSESLGGQDFAPSVRLEPSELAGFVQARRGLLPAASAGLATGQAQTLYGVGFDQSWANGTYAGVETTVAQSEGRRGIGVVRNASIVPVPDTVAQLAQDVDFREQEVAVYVGRLVGERWALGARYALSLASLETHFPELPASLPGAREFSADQTANLQRVQLFARFHHENGWFAEWLSEWLDQQVSGFADVPGAVVNEGNENFWQHHVWVGYRFPRRRAEVRCGILNLTDQDYRLRPLNSYREPWRQRTFEISLKLNF